MWDRFARAHREGEVVNGYHFEGGLAGLFVEPSPSRAMAFRIRAIDDATRQIRVHPVAALADDGKSLLTHFEPSIAAERWLRAGATVPLRLEMRMYRWCLCFGEFALNWQDLLAPDADH